MHPEKHPLNKNSTGYHQQPPAAWIKRQSNHNTAKIDSCKINREGTVLRSDGVDIKANESRTEVNRVKEIPA